MLERTLSAEADAPQVVLDRPALRGLVRSVRRRDPLFLHRAVGLQTARLGGGFMGTGSVNRGRITTLPKGLLRVVQPGDSKSPLAQRLPRARGSRKGGYWD